MPGTVDRSRVSYGHMALARTYSKPVLLGPPMCDELVALIEHMFTEDEADIVRHMKPLRARTASGLARTSGAPSQKSQRSFDTSRTTSSSFCRTARERRSSSP